MHPRLTVTPSWQRHAHVLQVLGGRSAQANDEPDLCSVPLSEQSETVSPDGLDRGLVVVVVVVVVWEGCDAAKAQPGLHHGDRAYRQVNSLYRTPYNFDLPGRGQHIVVL